MNRRGNDGSDGKHGAAGEKQRAAAEAPAPDPASERLLPPRGDYQTLLSFQKAEVVYDITFRFAHSYLAKSDRTIDQMIQSARSGKKNILEGNKAGRTSKQTYELYREFIDTRPPEIIANIAICLIHQTNFLIDRQLLRLEKDFLEQGGLRERMTRVRIAHRNAKPNKPTTDPPADLRQPNQPANAPTSPASHNSHDSHDRQPGPSGGAP